MAKQEQHTFYTIHGTKELVNLYLYHRNCMLELWTEWTELASSYLPFTLYEKFLELQSRELVSGEMSLIKRIWKFLHANNRINSNYGSEPFEKASPRAPEATFPDPDDPDLKKVPRIILYAKKSMRVQLLGYWTKKLIRTTISGEPFVPWFDQDKAPRNARPSRFSDLTTPSLTPASSSSMMTSEPSPQASSASTLPSSSNGFRSTGYSALDALAAAFEMPDATADTDIADEAAAAAESAQVLHAISALSNSSSVQPSHDPSDSDSSSDSVFTAKQKKIRRRQKNRITEPELSDSPDSLDVDAYLADFMTRHTTDPSGRLVRKPEMVLSEPPPPSTARTLRSDPRSPQKLVAPLAKNYAPTEPRLLAEVEAEHAAQAAVAAANAAKLADERRKKLDAANEKLRQKRAAKPALSVTRGRSIKAAAHAKQAALADPDREATAEEMALYGGRLDVRRRPATKVAKTPPRLSSSFVISSSSFTNPSISMRSQVAAQDLVALSAPQLAPAPLLSEAPKPSPNLRICIIGAGIAGLATAQCLKLHRIKDITILEARSRLGGRIHSTQINSTTVELGAQFTPDHAKNPISEMLTKLQLATRSYGATKPLENGHSHPLPASNASGSSTLHPSANSTESSSTQMNGIEPTPTTSTEARPPAPLVSKTPFLRSNLFQYGAHDYQLTTDKSSPRSYSSTGTDKLVLVEEGLSKLIGVLGRDVKIETGCAVHSVNFTSPLHKDPFFVHFRDSTGAIRQSAFDLVVVTLPLGVLKMGDVRFVPALPPSKREAIAKISVGHQNKCTMIFDVEFWEQKDDAIVYRDDQLGILVSSAESTPEVAMLQLFWCGDAAKTMNMLKPKEYVDNLIAKMAKSNGAEPKLKGFLWAPWSNDSSCYGAHSYIPAGEPHSLREQMAEPIFSGHLGFAGEHTAIMRPSTAHGAYESGIREARRIIETKAGLVFGTVKS